MICQHCGAVISLRTWYPSEGVSVVVWHKQGEPLRPGARSEWFAVDAHGAQAMNVCLANAPSNAHEPR